jgi:TRAP-type C4-dicarboxylate transport system substrate-binding protein
MVRTSAIRVLAGVVVVVVVLGGCGAPVDKAGGDLTAGPLVLKGIGARPSDEAQPFVDQVAALSGGSMTVELEGFWHVDSLTGEAESIEAVRSGATDFAVVPLRAWHDAGVNSFDAFIAPMVIDSYALQDSVLADPIAAEMLGGVAPLGLTGIGMLPGPMRKLGGANSNLLAPGDVQNLKIAISPGAVADRSIRALGGIPVQTNYDTGNVQGLDGLEGQLGVIGNPDYSNVQTLDTNVNLWPRAQVIVFNTAKFTALTDVQQQLLNRAAQQALPAASRLQLKNAGDDLREICHRGRLTMLVANQDQLQEFRQAFSPVIEWLSADEQTKKFLQTIQAMRATANTEPEGVPNCANLPSAALTTASSSTAAASPIDGRYEMVTSKQELIDFGEPADNANGSNYGTWERVFSNGRFTETQSSGATQTTADGTFTVDGNVLKMIFEGGEGTGPDGHAHRRAGEVDTWTWSIFHDQLSLQWIQPTLQPGQYPSPLNVKPWTRIGDAPAVVSPQTATTTPN